MFYGFDGEVAEKYGVDEAILLYHIAYWVYVNEAMEKNYLNGRYWTYNSGKAFERLFPYWKDRQIRNKLQHLVDEGLILKGTFGDNRYDHTCWYTLSDKGKSICQNWTFDWTKFTNQSDKNDQSYNTTTNNIDSNTYYNTDNKPYKDIKYSESIKEIIDYLNLKTGKHYTGKVKTDRDHIIARLKEGFTVDDFKKVIDNKVSKWLGDKKMDMYLRPKTLFSGNFEGYLNESETKKSEIDYSKHYYQKPEYVPQTEEEKRRSQEYWDSLEDEDYV